MLFYTWQAFTHSEAFTQRSFYTQRSLYTQQAFTFTQNLLHTGSFYRKKFSTEKLSCTQPQQELQVESQMDPGAKAKKKRDFEALFKWTFKRKIANAKIEKIYWQITVAALLQPLQYYLRDPAARDNSITHAAAAPSNLDAATTVRSAVPFIAGCNRFSRKNARFRAPASSPTQSPCNVHAAMTMHFAAWCG